MVTKMLHKERTMRLAVTIIAFVLCAPAFTATLEKLSIEQMAQQSTMIVRGQVTSCSGEARGSIIYTRCGVAVSETWKGAPSAKLDFLVPGGTFNGLTQTFTGTPKFAPKDEFVLFLWVGRSGIPQIIGLSQGVFGVSFSPGGQATVRREATTEVMLDSKGKQVQDKAVDIALPELRTRVNRALAGGAQK
jgi:hypothetical protein